MYILQLKLFFFRNSYQSHNRICIRVQIIGRDEQKCMSFLFVDRTVKFIVAISASFCDASRYPNNQNGN